MVILSFVLVVVSATALVVGIVLHIDAAVVASVAGSVVAAAMLGTALIRERRGQGPSAEKVHSGAEAYDSGPSYGSAGPEHQQPLADVDTVVQPSTAPPSAEPVGDMSHMYDTPPPSSTPPMSSTSHSVPPASVGPASVLTPERGDDATVVLSVMPHSPQKGQSAADELVEEGGAEATVALNPESSPASVRADDVQEEPSAPTEESVNEQAEEDAEVYDDPPDEPSSELLLSSEEKRIAELRDEVRVVDGRPRYHLGECEHLAQRASQTLSVGEATELGFTPCSLCSAATTILTRHL